MRLALVRESRVGPDWLHAIVCFPPNLRRPRPPSATAGLRRLRPSLGNGRLPDFHCKSVTIAPLAPYAPKAKIASERDEVPIRGTKQLLYQLLSLMFLTER